MHPKLKANFPQFHDISSLSYFPDIIDNAHLSTKSGICNYVDVQYVKLTRIYNVCNVMHLNVHSLMKGI